MRIPAIEIRRRTVIIGAVVVILLPILIFAIWALIALNLSYAKGERAGFLQKISERGWLCKTWEGELQMVAVPGSMPEKFPFTVRSESIATELNKVAGKAVVLTYEQHKGVPGSCFGDTEYFVKGVRLSQ